ncbi:hypothetical protein [Opitutus terrae]|uniref:Mu-like prophage I protein n=1 Tax=Opitutus terrae (strain DSM 11246 / JCM 15787 / PB90-1) TaxID=452637 RepID=B1ZV28_OPITP|nr:hypothetical protein [Opitutus terrae]ACB76695.1 hypothetical protein Oter_3418 [Opitutus terrae PB90-1]
MKPFLSLIRVLPILAYGFSNFAARIASLKRLKGCPEAGLIPAGDLDLANEAEPPAGSAEILGLCNELEFDDDGWALIPYGESRHSGKPAKLDLSNAADVALAERAKKGVIQRFAREDAERIVAEAKSLWGRIKRAVVGLPIFKGHPDAPNYAKRFPDKRERGGIGDMQVTDRGLRFRPVINQLGETDIESGWSEFSPYWVTRPVGERDGTPIVAPFRLKSIGLVPRGNIHGLSLVNAGREILSDDSENPTMNKHLIRLLAAMGFTLAPDATDDAAGAVVDQALPKFNAANAAATELPTVKSQVTALNSQLSALASEKLELANTKADLTGKLAAAETKATAARKAFASHVIASAIVAGRVQAAKKDEEELALVNSADIAAAAVEVDKREARFKTASGLGALKQRSAEAQSRQQTQLELVNAAMEETDIKALPPEDRYDAAWARAQKKNPAAFKLEP